MQRTEKPWGSEEMIEYNDRYMVKRLTMLQGRRCSLQYHESKCETIYVLAGELRISSGHRPEALQSRNLCVGESMTMAPGVIHRMEAIEDCIYLEASTPEMEDVVRLADDYRRIRQ